MDIKRALLPLAAIAAAAAIAVTAIIVGTGSDGGTVTAETISATRGIAVSGLGEVTIKPDTAHVDIGVQARGDTVEAARNEAAAAMDKVIASLKANGIAEGDIQTTSFSISPDYDYSSGNPVLRGYLVSNSVSAKIKRDANTVGEAAGKVIDDAATAGGDLTTVNGVRFSLDDPSAAVSQARERAMADARAKADQLAQLGKVTLGDLQFVSESGGFSVPPVPYYAAAAAGAESATPIQPGGLTISVSLSVSYTIK